MWVLHLQGMLIYSQALFLGYDFTKRVFEALEEASGVTIAVVVMLFCEICNIIHHCKKKKKRALAVPISKGRLGYPTEGTLGHCGDLFTFLTFSAYMWLAGHTPYRPIEPQSFVKTLLYPRTRTVSQFYAETRILN